jgi:hypothetical protein
LNDIINIFIVFIGLKDMKSKILTIKTKIKTVWKQGTNIKNERFGLVLFRNPRTSKYLLV